MTASLTPESVRIRTAPLRVGGAGVPLFDLDIENQAAPVQASQFSWRDARGVVLTPDFLVDLMVVTSLEALLGADAWSPDALDKLTWLDPAVGDGAFVLGILRHYFRVFGDEGNLSVRPRIVAVDRSAAAIESAKLRLKGFLLKTYGTASGPAKYVEFRVGDALELFSESYLRINPIEAFDIVIGNPPYIRHAHISLHDRKIAKNLYPGLYGGAADYFTYFFGAALNVARPGGIVSFITPASYIRNAAGRHLRDEINQRAAIQTFIDFDELSVFEGADVHTAVTIASVGDRQGCVNFKRFVSTSEATKASRSSPSLERRELRFTATGGWNFSPVGSRTYGRSRAFSTLAEQGVAVRSGVRSGAASVFLLENDQAESFTAGVREKWLRKAVIPTDIQRRGVATSKWLIWTPRGTEKPDSAILSYLEAHRSRLEARPEVLNGSTPWYALRSCAYSELLLRECIVGPDITSSLRFAIKPSNSILSDGSFAIDSVDPALPAILNSSWAEGFFRENSSSIGSLESKGRLRIKASILRQFPLPLKEKHNEASLSRLRDLWTSQSSGDDYFQSEINETVDEIYGRLE